MQGAGVLTRGTLGWATDDKNFTTLCPNGSEWVWDGLGECAQDGRDMASVFLGLFSITCFMGSSMPYVFAPHFIVALSISTVTGNVIP